MQTERKTQNTFWKLISDVPISIPKLQRDYAQGREEPGIDQIRDSLINDLFVSLNNDRVLTLNFIYGSYNGDDFVPIDGQQRLTTLFILHWYIFSRCKFEEGLERLCANFSYSTRDTSKRFCENIVKCGKNLNFCADKLSNQIEDDFWFVRGIYSDPTVRSMLRVIDAIHKRFKECDVELFKEKLIGENCPIDFLWLQMDNFTDTNDLYIKMNARGKVLSDFEIFKAKLQSSDILSKILDSDDDKERIKFISKFNNQYAELFYHFEQEHYDISMFAFLRTLIRDDYCAYACKMGVSQGTYREDYKLFDKMNGSMLFRFIEEGRFKSKEYEKCVNYEDILANTISKIDHLFGILRDNQELIDKSGISGKYSKYHLDDKDLFFIDYSKSKVGETLVRYAMFEYLNQFGYPNTDDRRSAYNQWKRFIYNIVNNTDVAGHTEYTCPAMIIIHELVQHIQCESSDGVLQMIEDYDTYDLDEYDIGIKYQVLEEMEKARLMRKNTTWFNSIIEAEEYFEDGQIAFLLNYAYDGAEYKLDSFSEAFDVSKNVFGAKKKLICNSSLFEKALLCMEDHTIHKTGHLIKQSNSKTTWGFLGTDNYRNILSNKPEKAEWEKDKKQQIIISLLKKLNSKEKVDDQLSCIIHDFNRGSLDRKTQWKKAFIDYDLFNQPISEGVKFCNCIHLGKENSEVLLLSGTTVRSYSIELYTLILYYMLKNKGVPAENIRRVVQTTGDIYRGTSFPIRYLEYNDRKIGYINDDEPHFAIKDNEENIVEKKWDEIVDYLLSLK